MRDFTALCPHNVQRSAEQGSAGLSSPSQLSFLFLVALSEQLQRKELWSLDPHLNVQKQNQVGVGF